MTRLRRQFLSTLAELGLVDMSAGPAAANTRSEDKELVMAVILAGMFPGVASAVVRKRRGRE